MICCPNCNSENNEFSISCSSCGGFIQKRVINLDLFSTIWGVIANPSNAFKTIVLAEHKNYIFLIYSLFGIASYFAMVWLYNAGNHFNHLLHLILNGILIGTLNGIIFLPIISLSFKIISKLFKLHITFLNAAAISGYSLIPIVLSLIIILPIEILTFGEYLFTKNPHPYLIKPYSYITLIGMDILCVAWSMILLIIGTKHGLQISLKKSIAIVIILSFFILSLLICVGYYATKFM